MEISIDGFESYLNDRKYLISVSVKMNFFKNCLDQEPSSLKIDGFGRTHRTYANYIPEDCSNFCKKALILDDKKSL